MISTEKGRDIKIANLLPANGEESAATTRTLQHTSWPPQSAAVAMRGRARRMAVAIIEMDFMAGVVLMTLECLRMGQSAIDAVLFFIPMAALFFGSFINMSKKIGAIK
jgi:hypothetical protein